MCARINGLEHYDACYCAGTGCGGHLVLNPAFANITPIGWQGAAQHTYTPACAGHHGPGPCPPSRQQSAIDAYQEASNEIHYLTGD